MLGLGGYIILDEKLVIWDHMENEEAEKAGGWIGEQNRNLEKI